MIYLERSPHPALAPFIHKLWYACDPKATHSRQRVLPTGRAQIVISLARDYLTDANHTTNPFERSPAGIFLGLYTAYQHIDAIDLAELIGVSFHPGGNLPFFPDNSSVFTDRETSIEDLWGPSFRALRDHLRELPTPERKCDLLEAYLLNRIQHSRTPARNPLIDFALTTLHHAPGIVAVHDLARTTGLSTRSLSQLVRENVGTAPKIYCRILRFQQAVKQLHRGVDISWTELALACGYYDQAHFANDFRAFSGMSPTSYTSAIRPWSNHIELD